MAKVNYGGIAQDVRGSIGGATHSRNLSGAYVRTKVSPVQRVTPASTFVKTSFAQFPARWGAQLSAAQRNAWNAFAAAHPRTNVFGQALILSGLAMYTACNRVIAALGGAVIDDPPTDLNVTALVTQTVTATAAAGALTALPLDVSPDPLAADEFLYVFATLPLAPGATSFKAGLRLISDPALPRDPADDAFTDYNTRFPLSGVAAGNRIGILIAAANDVTGALSPGLGGIITVA